MKITLLALLLIVIGIGIYILFTQVSAIAGWIVLGVLIAAIAIVAITTVPPLYKLYRFQKYFKQHEKDLNMLPGLMQSGHVQDALTRFEGVMKHAPDNAYIYYLRAFFLQSAGKLPEAMSAANKALSLVNRDPFLPMLLQQSGGQLGQPTTVEGFKEQLEDLRRTLEPRLNQMRTRREQAVAKRKKKSR
ncbi:MAG: tetratricopeptide repeat protein [Armatimonadota bacterium]